MSKRAEMPESYFWTHSMALTGEFTSMHFTFMEHVLLVKGRGLQKPLKFMVARTPPFLPPKDLVPRFLIPMLATWQGILRRMLLQIGIRLMSIGIDVQISAKSKSLSVKLFRRS